jgi:hypothetical protein
LIEIVNRNDVPVDCSVGCRVGGWGAVVAFAFLLVLIAGCGRCWYALFECGDFRLQQVDMLECISGVMFWHIFSF